MMPVEERGGGGVMQRSKGILSLPLCIALRCIISINNTSETNQPLPDRMWLVF